jgi:hypothetical protein
MRRLFSTFARGAPGAGLLLLRAAAATSLLTPAAHLLFGAPAELGVVGSVLCAVDAVFIALGLWTPLTALFGTLLGLARASGLHAHPGADLMLPAVTAALVLLGPGAWSIDARLFGWKRIEVAPRSGPALK